jgi:hypothetical protein
MVSAEPESGDDAVTEAGPGIGEGCGLQGDLQANDHIPFGHIPFGHSVRPRTRPFRSIPFGHSVRLFRSGLFRSATHKSCGVWAEWGEELLFKKRYGQNDTLQVF